MQYVTLEICHTIVFPYIYEQLTEEEPSSQYEGVTSWGKDISFDGLKQRVTKIFSTLYSSA